MHDTRQPRDYLHRENDGYWRYVRRVPVDLQTVIGKKMWRHSLGRDKITARQKARAFEHEHDALITTLRADPGAGQAMRLERALARSAARMAELHAKGAPDGRADQGDPENGGAPYPDAMPADAGTLESVLGDMWKRTPDVLEDIEEESDPAFRAQQLAAFAALAFGDQKRAQFEGLPQLPAPTGKVQAMQHAGNKLMLESVLEEIDPTPDDTPAEERLSGVLARYLDLKNRRGNTERSYQKKVRRFIEFAGDHALDAYAAADMRAYRDHLCKDLKPDSVRQYFAALKTLWAWAPKEIDRYKGLSFPPVTMPERATTVEDDRWQAFTDDQIKEVWRLLLAAWGAQAKSKMAPSRRAALLMCVRVLLYTGLRPVEVWALTPDNIEATADGPVLHIKQTKTAARRRIPLSAHLSDLPAFLEAGGFAAELESGVGRIYRGEVQTTPTTPESMEGTMRDAFRSIIHAGGIKHPKLVLYSLKDTLIRRLQALDVSDDLMRGVIGHSTGQKSLRNYKTPFGQSPEGMKKMRKALDSITYW